MGLEEKTALSPQFLGISDNSSGQWTKLEISSAEYCGTQFAGKGLFKSTVKFDLKWPQCQSEGLPAAVSPSYRQANSVLCPL